MKSHSPHLLGLCTSLIACHGFTSIRIPTIATKGQNQLFFSTKEQLYLQRPLSQTFLTAKNDDAVQELSGGLASMLLPMSSFIDTMTGGWGMTYADLTPETHETTTGVVFLATNLAYSLVGALLALHGDSLLGLLTECASVASFGYHFTQLKLGPDQAAVRLALLVDYIFAAAALLTGGLYVFAMSPLDIPMEGLLACALAVACLGASWIWERGMTYIIYHGLWHLLGAYGGYIIGEAHIAGAGTMA